MKITNDKNGKTILFTPETPLDSFNLGTITAKVKKYSLIVSQRNIIEVGIELGILVDAMGKIK